MLTGQLVVVKNGDQQNIPHQDNTCGIESLQLNFEESQPAKWTLTLKDPLGILNPRSGGAWSEWLDDQPYNSEDEYIKFFRPELIVEGVQLQFTGIPTAYAWAVDWEGRLLGLVWQGIDISEILFKESQVFQTYKSRQSQTYTAHEIIGEILTLYNINYQLLFDDFPVITAHLQNNRPIEFVKNLLEVAGAEWQIFGETFVAYIPQQNEQSANWTYNFGTSIVEEWEVNSSRPEIVNYVSMVRKKEASQGEEAYESTCKEFGTYTFTFPEPMRIISHVELASQDGVFINLIYRNAGGEVICVVNDVTGTYPINILGYPAYGVTTVEFTWHAAPDFIGTEGFGRIRWYALPVESPSNPEIDSGFDDEFSVAVQDLASVNAHGLRPKEFPDDSAIPNATMARTKLVAYLKKKHRENIESKAKIPLNIEMRPGDTVQEIYNYISLTRNVYVTKVEHRFSNDPEQNYTVYTGNEYSTSLNITDA